MNAAGELGFAYANLGEFDKSLEYLDKAIWASPHDPTLRYWYGAKAEANFALKNYDQAIELARRAIAINPDYNAFAHAILVAALALTGHDAEAREALKRFLALPSTGPFKTIAGMERPLRLRTARRSAPRRSRRTDPRRPAQGRDAGAMSETRKLAAILCRRCRRLFQARRRGRGSHPGAAAGAAQRSDRPDHRRAPRPIVKRTGDGSLIEFRSVVDAVRARSKCRTR